MTVSTFKLRQRYGGSKAMTVARIAMRRWGGGGGRERGARAHIEGTWGV